MPDFIDPAGTRVIPETARIFAFANPGGFESMFPQHFHGAPRFFSGTGGNRFA
jgi:hypothetical protein